MSGSDDQIATDISLTAGSGITITPSVSGNTATITIAASGGGGGTSDHTALTNLAWTSSAHTGTASRIAAFNSSGAASYLQIGADVQAWSTTLDAVTAGTWTGSTAITTLGTVSSGTWQGTAIGLAYGGTGSTTASGARTALGLAIGTDVQAYDSDLSAVAGLSSAGLIARTGSGTAAARTVSAGTGIAVTNGDGVAGNPSIAVDSTVYRSGGTDVAVADGGTGSSTASGARSNLGLAIGSDVQAYDAQLAALAATSPSSGSLHWWSSATVANVLSIGAEGSVLTVSSGAPIWKTLAIAVGISSTQIDLAVGAGMFAEAAPSVSSGAIV
jgi:hypothetical protein